MSVGAVTYVSCIASSIDTSTVSATPVRDARRHAVDRAERRERADDVLAEVARRRSTAAGPCGRAPTRLPLRACSTSSGSSRPSSGPPWPTAVIDTVTSGAACAGAAAGLADDHDVGRRRATGARVGARAAATCAGR